MSSPNKAPSVTTAVAGTAAVSILPASGDAKGYRDIVALIITTADAAASVLTLSDGTGNRMVINYPNAASAPSTPFVIPFPVPLQQSAPNLAWTLQASVNASGFNVTVQYVDR